MGFIEVDPDETEALLQQLRENFPGKSDEWLYAWLLSAQSYLATGVGRPDLLGGLS